MCCSYQGFLAVQRQCLDPRPHTPHITGLMGPQDRRLEDLQCECQDGTAGVVFARLFGGRRVDAVPASAVQYPAVLHHAPLRKDDHLPAPQDLFGQERKKPRVIVRYPADA